MITATSRHMKSLSLLIRPYPWLWGVMKPFFSVSSVMHEPWISPSQSKARVQSLYIELINWTCWVLSASLLWLIQSRLTQSDLIWLFNCSRRKTRWRLLVARLEWSLSSMGRSSTEGPKNTTILQILVSHSKRHVSRQYILSLSFSGGRLTSRISRAEKSRDS